MTLKAPFPWPDIEVREDGSIWRVVSQGKPCAPRRIDNPDLSKGYRNVRLPGASGWRTHKAHRLVWEWHYGPIPDGMQVNHIDLDKANNRIANLELVTPSGNIAHSYAHGRTRPWSRTANWRGKPVLGADTKAAMRAAREGGSSLKEIAARFGCSITHAQRITGSRQPERSSWEAPRRRL